MDNSLDLIIDLAVKSTYEEFKRNPFEYAQNEREAQFNLFNKLKHMVTGVIKVNREEPKPPFVNLQSRRVRVEYKLKKSFKPDIVIFKNQIINEKKLVLMM